jgi:hypothetical protein
MTVKKHKPKIHICADEERSNTAGFDLLPLARMIARRHISLQKNRLAPSDKYHEGIALPDKVQRERKP